MCPECRNEQDVSENIKEEVRCIVCGEVIAESSETGTKLKGRLIHKTVEINEEEFLEDKRKCENCGKVPKKRFLDHRIPTHFVCRDCRGKK